MRTKPAKMSRWLAIFILLSITSAQSTKLTFRKIDPSDYGMGRENDDFDRRFTNLGIDGYDAQQNAHETDDRYNNNGDWTFAELDNDLTNSRRLFGWFSNLFNATTENFTETVATTTEFNYQSDLNERIFFKELHRNLSAVLSKLSDIEQRVSQVTQLRESYTVLTKGKPEIFGLRHNNYYLKRSKRDNEINEVKPPVTDSTISTNGTNSTEANSTVTDLTCGNISSSGRRFASAFTPTEVKKKLLTYLDESFLDIKNKIKSLKSIKQAFSDDINFRIGYIMANIDTLELNLSNMKQNTDKNKDLWEDKKILELYDTLKVSNQAVSGLIESLKIYIDQLSEIKAQSKNVGFLNNMQSETLPRQLEITG